MKTWILGGLALAAGLAACSSKVIITAETSGSASGSGGSTATTMGTGAASPGGTGGSTGTGTPGSGKLVTADTDIAQYQSITVTGPNTPSTPVKVVEGPFFVTDVFGYVGFAELSTVTGSDCTVSQDKHTRVLQVSNNGASVAVGAQAHGIRIPVLAGQSLCVPNVPAYQAPLTVLGFKPY